ncbi:head GIN domain-containing protein [Persicobacter diffluens]|uniref:Putative auto-transporter adhesin head GIN domain-containing protein n=1 Tax=Persicobacter diffluens TaxID=981 RepID=A0AAN4W000_9BACT|nr:hypothetical protein PEDI_24870 [Persicobacter diffluens]
MKRIYSLLLLMSFSLIAFANDSVKEERKVSDFQAIYMEGALKIIITQGPENRLSLEGANQKVLDAMTTTVTGGKLKLKFPDQNFGVRLPKATVYLQVKNLESIEVVGAVKVFSKTPLIANHLNVELTGSCEANLMVEVKHLEFQSTGVGSATFKGQAESLSVNMEGTGKLNAESLQCQTTDVELEGFCKATVCADKKISGHAEGFSKIRFTGNPEVNQLGKSDFSKIKQIN